MKHGSGKRLDGVAGTHVAAVRPSAAVIPRGGVATVGAGRGMIVGRRRLHVDRGLVGVRGVVIPEDGGRRHGTLTRRGRMRRGNHEDSRGDRKQDSDDEAHQPQG